MSSRCTAKVQRGGRESGGNRMAQRMVQRDSQSAYGKSLVEIGREVRVAAEGAKQVARNNSSGPFPIPPRS